MVPLQPQNGPPDDRRYHVLVRTSEDRRAKSVELTRDEFLRLERELSTTRSALPHPKEAAGRIDVRLIEHRAGYGGRAQRIHPADLRRCLESNSYLRIEVLQSLRELAAE